jgi:hypothetical protein
MHPAFDEPDGSHRPPQSRDGSPPLRGFSSVGVCQLTPPTSSRGSIYANTIPAKFSKMALIEKGQWTTDASV